MRDEPRVDVNPAAEPGAAGLAAEAVETPADATPREGKKGKTMGRKEKTAQLEALTRERDDLEQARLALQDRVIRLQADFENFRKRTLREKSELFRSANEDLMSELLPVLDHFDMALDAARNASAPEALAEGVRMVREQLSAVLARFGLQAVEAGGQPFDPTLHEAISHLPSETVPENGVMAQTRRGYRLGDKLIRPSQVVVSSGAPAAAAPSLPKPETGAAPDEE